MFARGELKSLSKVIWVAWGGICSVDLRMTLRGFSNHSLLVFESLLITIRQVGNKNEKERR